MERLLVFPVLLLGVVSCSQDQISGSVLNLTHRPGDNITLYCDCQRSSGVYIAWYRNCSHENQPPLVLSTRFKTGLDLNTTDPLNPFPRFRLFWNQSSESYDLRITSITDSDEGLYYCGTEQNKVEQEKYITSRVHYKYGNFTTRIILTHAVGTPQDGCGCWSLLFSLCPASAAASSLLSSLVVYHLCKKKAKEPQVEQQIPDTRGQTKGNQDEDVCYAALEIRQASQRPMKKKKLSSDFSTYSAINTSRL